jgi:hypothetical protein
MVMMIIFFFFYGEEKGDEKMNFGKKMDKKNHGI